MYKILSVVLLGLMVAFPAFAVSPTWGDKNTLKGIKTVCVYAEGVAGDASQAGYYGVTPSTLKARVERRLKEARIDVSSLDECKLVPGSPYLQVTAVVTVWAGMETYLAFTVDLDFLQNVILDRDKSNKALVPTWRSSSDGITPNMSLQEFVMWAIDGRVKEFSEDYFAVNR